MKYEFREYPDKHRGITTARLAGRQHFVLVGNRPKRHNPGGWDPLRGTITKPSRDGVLLPAKPLL